MGIPSDLGSKAKISSEYSIRICPIKIRLKLFVSGFTDEVAFFTGKILRSTPFVCFLTNKTKEQNNPVLPLSGTFGNAKRKTNLKVCVKNKLICLSCFSFKMGDIEVMVAVVEVSVVAVLVTVAAIIADSLHGKH